MNPEITFYNAKKVLHDQIDNDLPKIKITILRNIIIDQMEVFLKYFGSQSGLSLQINLGNFDSILQDATENRSIINSDTNFIIIFYNLRSAFKQVETSFNSLKKETLDDIKYTISDLFLSTVEKINANSNATILVPTFEKFFYSTNGIYDNSSLSFGQNNFINELNLMLTNQLSKYSNCFLIDLDRIISRKGCESFYDQERHYTSAAPFSLLGQRELALEFSKYVSATFGKSKKVLALDCDNTLWSGIVGEDGTQGIALGNTNKGKIFQEFQLFIKDLIQKGVIVALCSKNNESDVWEVFEKNPNMILSKNDISCWRINWQDKATNLREISSELKIGLDSFVFVDDSSIECELVKQEIPECMTIQINKDSPINIVNNLKRLGIFDTLFISQEDKLKTSMYRANKVRESEKNNASNLEDFLKSLNIEIIIKRCDESSKLRVAQLTQKTNQFNFTTKRYSLSEIETFMSSDTKRVLQVAASDRFGELGLIGVAIINLENDTAHIETFLLSCRALGRKIEVRIIGEIIDYLKSQNIKTVYGHYVPTNKNNQIQNFYSDLGFMEASKENEQFIFRAEISNFTYPISKQLHSVVNNI